MSRLALASNERRFLLTVQVWPPQIIQAVYGRPRNRAPLRPHGEPEPGVRELEPNRRLAPTILIAGVVRLVNPQAAYAFTLEGPDPQGLPLDAPPTFASAHQAAEACELYWQALTRDVPFSDYVADRTIAGACTELSSLDVRGPRVDGTVTPATIFRGSTPGDLRGPYEMRACFHEDFGGFSLTTFDGAAVTV